MVHIFILYARFLRFNSNIPYLIAYDNFFFINSPHYEVFSSSLWFCLYVFADCFISPSSLFEMYTHKSSEIFKQFNLLICTHIDTHTHTHICLIDLLAQFIFFFFFFFLFSFLFHKPMMIQAVAAAEDYFFFYCFYLLLLFLLCLSFIVFPLIKLFDFDHFIHYFCSNIYFVVFSHS